MPTLQNIPLSGGGRRCEGTVLYADLAQSSLLGTDFQQTTAAKVLKSFLRCCTQLITKNKGTVTSFDGDRVMGVFIGKTKENQATLTGLQINAAVSEILRPRLNDHFQSMSESPYDIDHCVGIDQGEFLAVRAGHAGSSGLIWIGRAPNLAAKLSDVRHAKYKTVITDPVYKALSSDYVLTKTSCENMWDRSSFTFLNQPFTVYASGGLWHP